MSPDGDDLPPDRIEAIAPLRCLDDEALRRAAMDRFPEERLPRGSRSRVRYQLKRKDGTWVILFRELAQTLEP